MKGMSFDRMLNLKRMSDKMAVLGGVPYWNAGVNVILYRNGNDSIAYHCDDTQNEQMIGTALISACENNNRPTIFKSKTVNQHDSKVPIIKVLLHLKPGDVYYMNTDVQKEFVHGVEKTNPVLAPTLHNVDASIGNRVVVVCRYGQEIQVKKDSGRSQKSLLPRLKQPLVFGETSSLVVDHLYSKCDLRNMNVHE